MKPNIKYLQFFFSLTIVAFIYVLFHILIQSKNDPVNNGVSIYFLVLIISSTAIATAFVVLFLKFSGRSKFKNSFFYNLTGVVNFCLGAGFIIMLFLDKLDGTSLFRFSLNLILGTIIIADIILRNDSGNKD